jgi:Family of unknown function (DUF6308)
VRRAGESGGLIDSMAGARSIALSSGCTVDTPLERLLSFFGEEYAYYDAIPSVLPDSVVPVDLFVTAAVNARLGTAETIRAMHRELAAACDPLLAGIPEGAELEEFPIGPLAELIHAAVGCFGVGFAVATKVLHRKRRGALPMFDSVLLNHYTGGPPGGETPPRFYNKRRARENAAEMLELVRRDLQDASEDLEQLRRALEDAGFAVTRARIVDALLWTSYETRGVYRIDDPEPAVVEQIETDVAEQSDEIP